MEPAQNPLAMQLLAARFRRHAAETSIDVFRRKFEAAAQELEREAGAPLTMELNSRGQEPRDRGTGPIYGY